MDYFNPQPKPFSNPKLDKPLKKVSEKNKGKGGFPKPTGELALFKAKWKKLRGRCEVTGVKIDFHPNCFAHILSKGAYSKFKLHEPNIIMVQEEIHFLYDNSSEEILLQQYPEAKIIYERKEELKIEYHKPKPTA